MSRLFLLLAVVMCGAGGCTYSGAKRGEATAQASTADPYTSEFQHRIPPGGD